MIAFKPFIVSDLFVIHPTQAYDLKDKDLRLAEGTTPVLSNSSVNNGIKGYSSLNPTEQNGVITFSDTTTGADTMFYQPFPFIGYPHVQGMYPLQPDKWSEACCLYVISCLRRSAGKGWSYSTKFTRKQVSSLKILLPVIASPCPDYEYTINDIDWKYMEERIARLKKEHIAKLKQECLSKLAAYLKASGLNSFELAEDDLKDAIIKAVQK